MKRLDNAKYLVSRYLKLSNLFMVFPSSLTCPTLSSLKHKYSVAENGDLDRVIAHRFQAVWKNWKRILGVLFDKRIG